VRFPGKLFPENWFVFLPGTAATLALLRVDRCLELFENHRDTGIERRTSPHFSLLMASQSRQARSKFTLEEDEALRGLVSEYGTSNWIEVSSWLPGRSPRQCRERWKHYLSTEKAEIPWTEAEDRILFEKISEWGAKWTRVAKVLGDRSDLEVKVRWLKKFNHIIRLLPKSNRDPIPLPDRPREPPAGESLFGAPAELVIILEEKEWLDLVEKPSDEASTQWDTV
jgi:hypothetical protein